MTTSLARPRLDFETNVVGTVNLLEAICLPVEQVYLGRG